MWKQLQTFRHSFDQVEYPYMCSGDSQRACYAGHVIEISGAMSRRWDDFAGYLCDIDGTLMRCTDLVHYNAFNRAMSEIAGRHITIDGVATEGNVDLAILREAFQLHGVEKTAWEPRRDWAVAEMGRFVAQSSAELEFHILPMVRELLMHLKSRGAFLSTATGNFEAIGKAKLARAGLLDLFDQGGWSDGWETRTEVFAAAAKALRERMGGANTPLCVLGDTPADIRSARACGLSVIAVATGIYSVEQLRTESPDFLVASFRDLLQEERIAAAQG